MTLCVIPARGGSKRIPRKNLKEFLGKPIIAYSIQAAQESNCFKKIIVSTDDEEIAELAIKYGAQVPFIRSKELSDDHTPTFMVVKDAIEKIDFHNQIENVFCLYATAPFVDATVVNDSYTEFIQSNADYCLGVTSYSFPIQRALHLSDKNRLEMFEVKNSMKRSQDLEEAYHDAGQFYWGKKQAFKDEIPIFSKFSSPYILPRYLVQDIDNNEDWIRAELMFKVLQN